MRSCRIRVPHRQRINSTKSMHDVLSFHQLVLAKSTAEYPMRQRLHDAEKRISKLRIEIGTGHRYNEDIAAGEARSVSSPSNLVNDSQLSHYQARCLCQAEAEQSESRGRLAGTCEPTGRQAGKQAALHCLLDGAFHLRDHLTTWPPTASAYSCKADVIFSVHEYAPSAL